MTMSIQTAVALYLRNSSAENSSLADQEALLRNYCDLKGYQIVRIATENACGTASFGERHLLKHLLDTSETLGAKKIIISRLDRLSRSTETLQKLQDSVNSKGLVLEEAVD